MRWLEWVMAAAGLPAPSGVAEFGGGTFNRVLRVTTGDGDVVVKVAPDPQLPVLTYEHGIMATEALYYRLAAERGIASVPRVLHHGNVDDSEVLVLSVCPGRPCAEGIDEELVYGLRSEVGRELAALHRITGPGFGYPARPLHATWRSAFTDMLDVLLTDAVHYGSTLPRPPREIAAIVEGVGSALDEVRTPALVHFDLWDGNILADGPRLGGLIDAERAFWGDPLAELVSLRLFGELAPDAGLLAGYGAFASDEAARVRLTLYRLYLYLIMWVEAVPRRLGPDSVAWRHASVFEPAAAMLGVLAAA
jgi:fructosamine-3-kinase